MNSSDALVGQVIDTRYQVENLVARGGMASVYRARDLRLDRTVAVKVMDRSLAKDPGFVARFHREAKAAARLHHPNLVTVFDQGVYDGLVWLAMDYVPGHTLRRIVDVHAPLDPDRALGVIEQVLEGLVAAHAAGFIHRDVKPENVLMTANGVMRLVDFGLTRALGDDDPSGSTKGVVIGTVAYMAPEQVEQGVADARSDIYAVGVLLFELLTATVPFHAPTPLAVAYRHVHDPVPPPSTLRNGIPADVDELVRRSTAKAPSDRYQSAADFLTAVRGADLTPIAVPMSTPAPMGSDSRPADADVTIFPAGTITADLRLARERDWDDIATVTHTGTAVLTGADSGTSILTDSNSTAVVSPSTAVVSPSPGTDLALAALASKVRSARRFSRAALTLMLSLVTALVATGAWWLGGLQTHPLIDVRGLSVAEAQQRLVLFEVSLDVAGEQFDDAVPAGTIISTSPDPGSRIRVGGTVGAVVSLGPQARAVPRVVGLSESAAVSELESAGFAVSVNKRLPFVVLDVIYSQTPGSGTELVTGSTVIINLV